MTGTINQQRFIVTGGAGFIGSHMVKYLLQKYPACEVICLDKLSYASDYLLQNLRLAEENERFKFEQIDLAESFEAVKSVIGLKMAECDSLTIFNFAAESCVDLLFLDPLLFTKNNILATQNILEAMRVLNLQMPSHADKVFLVHVSTDEVYGEQRIGDLADENAPLKPSNPYAASKAACDLIVGAYVKSYQLPVTIVRANNVYGPGQHPEKLIAKTLHMLRYSCPERGIEPQKRLSLHGNGHHKRRYLHVHDFVRAVDCILQNSRRGGIIGDIYNAGTDEEWSNVDLVEMICQRYMESIHGVEAHDFSCYYTFGKDRLYNDIRYRIDYSKLTMMGWQPEINVKDGVGKMIREIKRTGDKFA